VLSQGEDLPAEDPKGPNIGLGGEQAIYQALRRHPAHRQQALALLPVVVALVDVPRQSKVSDLHSPPPIRRSARRFRDQTVPAGQVAVHEVHVLQVTAAIGHIDAHGQELRERQTSQGLRILKLPNKYYNIYIFHIILQLTGKEANFAKPKLIYPCS